jgi:hypothetical protein
LIMISGLVIYAIFHKRAAGGVPIPAPGHE